MLIRSALLAAMVAATPMLALTEDPDRTGSSPAGSFIDASMKTSPDATGIHFADLDIDALLRARVVDRGGRIVGTVAEIAVASTGLVTDAIVRVSGGSLGVTGQQVTVPIAALEIVNEGRFGFDSYLVRTRDDRTEILAQAAY